MKDAELELTTISIRQNATEANMVKNRLEAAGIRAYLSGEEAVATTGNARGGIKVQVAARDAENALDLLEQESWQRSPEQENTAFATSATLSALEEEEMLSDRDRAASAAGRFNDAELELTTISILRNAAEANMVKNRLEAAGIRAYLSGEEAAAMAWYLVS